MQQKNTQRKKVVNIKQMQLKIEMLYLILCFVRFIHFFGKQQILKITYDFFHIFRQVLNA